MQHQNTQKLMLTLLSLVAFYSSYAQVKLVESDQADFRHVSILYQDTTKQEQRILLPEAQSRNTPKMPLVFDIDYGGMPDFAIAAFDHATQLLSEQLSSAVPIKVQVNWNQTDFSFLAAAFSSFATNFPNSTEKIAYPMPLAEKLAGVPINEESEPDLTVIINRNNRWFYEFNNPTAIQEAEYDFVTVMLHEIIHGLGFTGRTAIGTDDRTGYIRYDFEENEYDSTGTVAIFNLYAVNGAGKYIFRNFEDQTIKLGNALQSNNVYLKTPHADAANLPRLYAPTRYAPGSSFHHLNTFTYDNTDNALMRPSLYSGTIIHKLGIALDMLHDIGWSTTHILHKETALEENLDQALAITATVNSDVGYAANTVMLHYSQDTFQTVTSELMIPTSQSDQYTFSIPAPSTTTKFQYYFTVIDSKGVTLPFPQLAPNPLFFETSYEGLPTATEELIVQETFKIYPNPITTSTLTVEAVFNQVVGDAQLTVHDGLGRLLSSSMVIINGLTIRETVDVEGFDRGIYVVNLWVDGAVQNSKKVLVE